MLHEFNPHTHIYAVYIYKFSIRFFCNYHRYIKTREYRIKVNKGTSQYVLQDKSKGRNVRC